MIRMRTIAQAVEHFKAQDPDTCLTEWYIRGLVKRGVVPCHKAGNKKYLVNLDALEAYLASPPAEEPHLHLNGRIRRVDL